MSLAHLLDGLADLSPSDVRSRLLQAKAGVGALLATDLQPTIRERLKAGMADVDAGLAAAAIQALTDTVGHHRAATAASALKPRPPVNAAARPLVRIPDAPAATVAGPAVAESAAAPAPVAPRPLLRPVPPDRRPLPQARRPWFGPEVSLD